MNTSIRNMSLTDIRCFAGEHGADLSRITLLVGENSVGKTTFLGCLNALGQLAGLKDLEDKTNYFDQSPFSMGPFDTIARSGSTSFRVSLNLEGGPFSHFGIEFAEDGGTRLKEASLELQLSDGPSGANSTMTIVRESSGTSSERWLFTGPAFQFRLDQADISHVQFTTWLSHSIRYGQLPFEGEATKFRKRTGQTADRDLAAFGRFVNFFRHQFRAPENPLRIVPIHPHGLKPQRDYNFESLGSLGDQSDLGAINKTGSDLGLFNQIDVRRIDRDSFEVLVDVSGSLRNLRDVGYGVSSLLPFLDALTSAPQHTLFLLQQPEVHVHPSAQAKLVEMMARSDHAFIIETHSDHVIDWLRIFAKEKDRHLAPSDVAIIYFETLPDDGSVTRLHQISLDRHANLSGQPHSYRRFFSQETARLLGLST